MSATLYPPAFAAVTHGPTGARPGGAYAAAPLRRVDSTLLVVALTVGGFCVYDPVASPGGIE